MTAEGSGPAEGTAIGAGVAVRHTTGLMVLLTAMTALAPLSLQIFVPALPAIQATFGVTVGTAQLVLSLSILANAFATLGYGPLSDRFGRRPVVLGGLVAFIAGSIMCTLAPDIGTLIAGRIIQAMGAAAGMVLARAMVRDLYDRERAASVIAYLTMAMVVAPMLAPTIGAVLADFVGWRSIFTGLTVVGIVMIVWCASRLIETRASHAGGRLLTGAGALLASPQFLAYTLQMAFSIAVFFAFVAGAPYFMIDVLGRPATEYVL
jgi:DHA1 family bicyclomycin/chloramphenicol resistance-like MFS transporter